MNKLESTIPFDGFYNSFISADIEHQMGQQIEWDCDLYDLDRRKEENIKLNNNDLFGTDIVGYSI